MSSKLLGTPRRFDSFSQSQCSVVLTSTPLNVRPIHTIEPVQSPIGITNNNKSQPVVTPARETRSLRARPGGSTSISKELSVSKYHTRSRSRILEESSLLQKSISPKSNSIAKDTLKTHEMMPEWKPVAIKNRSKTLPDIMETENKEKYKNGKQVQKDNLFKLQVSSNVKPFFIFQELAKFSLQYPHDFDSVVKKMVDIPKEYKNGKQVQKDNLFKLQVSSNVKPFFIFQELAKFPLQYPHDFDNVVKKIVDIPKDASKSAAVSKHAKKSTSEKKSRREYEVLSPKHQENVKKIENNIISVNNQNVFSKIPQSINRNSVVSKSNEENFINRKPPKTKNTNLVDTESNTNSKSVFKHPIVTSEYCDSTTDRKSDTFSNCSSKPSFIRRKLYSCSADYTDTESFKQSNASFLDKNDVKNVYSLKKKETNRNVASTGADQQTNTDQTEDNLRQYCLRKNIAKNYNPVFEDGQVIINCEIKDAKKAKETTSKMVSTLLKGINKLTAPLPTEKSNVKKTEEVVTDKADKINVDLDDSCFDLFTQKEKNNSPKKVEKKQKVLPKVQKSTKVIETKTVKKIPNKKSSDSKQQRSTEKSKNKPSVRKNANTENKGVVVALEEIKPRKSNRQKNESFKSNRNHSYTLRSSSSQKSYLDDLDHSQLRFVLPPTDTSCLLKKKVNAPSSRGRKTLEITYTTKRRIRKQVQNTKEFDYPIKGSYQQLKASSIDDTISFKNGKIISGKFGDKASTNTSISLSSGRNSDTRNKPNIKLNFQNQRFGIDDFNTFEKKYYRRELKPFSNRNIPDLVRETKQHMQHNQYVFKKPSNVLWNPNPSLEYRTCGGKRFDLGYSNSTSLTSFKDSTVRSILADSQLSSCFPKNGNCALKLNYGQSEKTKTLNKLITTVCEQDKEMLHSRMHNRDSQFLLPNEGSRISSSMQRTNNISLVKHYGREPLGRYEFGTNQESGIKYRNTLSTDIMNIGPSSLGGGFSEMEGNEIYGSRNGIKQSKRDFSNRLRKPISYGVHREISDGIVDLHRSKFKTTYSNSTMNSAIGENTYKLGKYEEDPYQITNRLTKTTLSNPLKKISNQYLFGESESDFGDYDHELDSLPRKRMRPEINRNPTISTFDQGLPDLHKGPMRFTDTLTHLERTENFHPVGFSHNTVERSRNTICGINRQPQPNGYSDVCSGNLMEESTYSLIFREPKHIDYSVCNTYRMPIDGVRKRKLAQYEECNETSGSMMKRSRIEESRFSTISNTNMLRKMDNNMVRSEKNQPVCSFIMKSSATVNVVRNDIQKVVLPEKEINPPLQNNDDSDCNLSDNLSDHEDTVISSNDFFSKKATNSKLAKPTTIVQNLPQSAKVLEIDAVTTTAKTTSNNKAYDICDDEVSKVIGKKNEDSDNDKEDTFFFKGTYTARTTAADSTKGVSQINDVPSVAGGKQFAKEKPKQSVISEIYKDFAKKYSLQPASTISLASTSSVQQTDAFKKPLSTSKWPLPVQTENPTPNKEDDPVSRVTNCSPWRLRTW